MDKFKSDLEEEMNDGKEITREIFKLNKFLENLKKVHESMEAQYRILQSKGYESRDFEDKLKKAKDAYARAEAAIKSDIKRFSQ